MALNWSPASPKWTTEELALLPTTFTPLKTTSLNTILLKSETFKRKFPIETNLCKTLKEIPETSEETLQRNINSTYPLLHENILNLYAKFVLHKREFGNPIEKTVYKTMDLNQFIERLLTKRAATFIGKADSFTLLNGHKGRSKWETIGTPEERDPLTLTNCISYEEVKLSAFLSVSSYTHFINRGDRKNFGKPEPNRELVQDEGIIVGIIGPRLIKTGSMDYQELVVTEKQNNRENGYGPGTPTIHHLFCGLYEEPCLEFMDIDKTDVRFTKLKDKAEVLDNFVYLKRLVFTMDTLFLEANQRAAETQTTAFVHVVGIGLGVWKKAEIQNRLFMDACAQRLQFLAKNLSSVSDVCFAYINHNSCGKYKHGDVIPIEGHPSQGIKVHICKREPHEKLTGVDSGKLLVVSYAWDGNALPGNEYWNGKLGSSGDSAAASSTQISELHNPFINPKVSAANLRVATSTQGLVSLDEYITKVINNEKKRKHSP